VLNTEKPSSSLRALNPQQEQAVIHCGLDNHILVIAPAGTGKTRCLIGRINHLLGQEAYSPSSILALTFTNEAATNLKTKLSGHKGVWCGTFHSVCFKILRQELPPFTILLNTDREQVIKTLLANEHIDPDIYHIDSVSKFIDSIKRQGIRAVDYKPKAGDDFALTMRRLYQAYESYCLQSSLLDFTELLLRTIELFNSNPSVLNRYRSRLKVVACDEFQDSEYLQIQLMQMLVSIGAKLYAVGDDNQAIYSFRGCDPKYINDFAQYFPNSKIFTLNTNYRSTQAILDVANSLVPKDSALVSFQGDSGTLPKLHFPIDDISEAHFIAREITYLTEHRDVGLGQILILSRTKKQYRLLTESFKRYEIPYCIKSENDIDFLQREPIKDIFAYLRFLQNPSDSNALQRIINKPPRRIGEQTISSLLKLSEGRTLWQTIHYAIQKNLISKRAIKPISNFLELVNSLNQIANSSDSLSTKIDSIIQMSGLKEYHTPTEDSLRRGHDSELVHIEKFLEIVQIAESKGVQSILDFLARISLKIDNLQDKQDSVSLMTVHASKGLERRVVFLIGFSARWFPLSLGNMQEEKRLAYVGLTRALEDLYVTCPGSITTGKGIENSLPSPFLDLIPPVCFEKITESSQKQINQQPLITAQQPDFDSETWLTAKQFSLRMGIHHKRAQKVLSDAYKKRLLWRGTYLKIDFDTPSGTYYVHRDSLPEESKTAYVPTEKTTVSDEKTMVSDKSLIDTSRPMANMGTFCDWITIYQDFSYELPPLNDGKVVFYKADGKIEFTVFKSFKLEGSYSSSIQIRVAGHRISVSGNVGMWFRKENVFNYTFENTIRKLNEEILEQPAFKKYPKFTTGEPALIRYKRDTREGIKTGATMGYDGARISRIDLTQNKGVLTETQKLEYLHFLANINITGFTPRIKRDSLGRVRTVYFKNTMMTLKVYDKTYQFYCRYTKKINIKRDPYYIKMYEWLQAHNVIRFELKLQSHYLGQHEDKLNFLGGIMKNSGQLNVIFRKQMKPLMSGADISKVPLLPPQTALYYQNWLAGRPITSVIMPNGKPISRRTINTHKKIVKDILGDAVDITNPIPLTRAIAISTTRVELTNLEPMEGYYLPEIGKTPYPHLKLVVNN
jgi:DNA helicase-2/ATP-dependent DNA helicase PcrA